MSGVLDDMNVSSQETFWSSDVIGGSHWTNRVPLKRNHSRENFHLLLRMAVSHETNILHSNQFRHLKGQFTHSFSYCSFSNIEQSGLIFNNYKNKLWVNFIRTLGNKRPSHPRNALIILIHFGQWKRTRKPTHYIEMKGCVLTANLRFTA